MTPPTYSLVSVSTRSEKKGVEVIFASPQKRLSKFYPFFPSLFLPHHLQNTFDELLPQLDLPKYQTITHPHSLQVTATHFEDLKRIAHAVFQHTAYYPSLLEPERQFLLLQGWRYFQGFDDHGNPLPHLFGDTRLDEMTDSLHPTLNALRTHNPHVWKDIMERLALSHELFIPYTAVPPSPEERLNTLLENHFFTHTHAQPITPGQRLTTSTWSMGERELAKRRVFQTPLEGEGQCACCRPQMAIESHVHPGTLVEAIATQDGVYIHTHQEAMSTAYDTTHDHSTRRISHAREWGLRILPIGPLHREEKILIPLTDALAAHHQGLITIHLPENAAWHCHRTPFLLARLKNALDERLSSHQTQETMLLQPYLQQYQLAFTQYSQTNPTVQFHHAASTIIQNLYGGLAWHLVQGPTPWRDATMARLLSQSLP
ncbi:MAG: hypothetical protein Q8P05_05975 [Candidatus Diapherotrites archaeon]|nr:hypothetical protein [Candidatus Diapherotrites archaeon]MDZ4256007.1 hypothetical protein [archaeon]